MMKKYKTALLGITILSGIAFGPLQLVNAETANPNESTSAIKTDLSDTITTGKWGNETNSATWSFDSTTGTLTIGAGIIGNSAQRPWSMATPPYGVIADTNVTTVVIGKDVSLSADSSSIFANLPNVTKFVGLENLKTDQAINMSNMFKGATSLKDLDLSSFETKQVTDMTNVITNADKLNTFNLSNWIISSGTKVGTAFIKMGSMPNTKTFILHNMQIKDDSLKFYDNAVNFINLGDSTIENPNVIKTVLGTELTAAINEDYAGLLEGSKGVWIKEPTKMDQTQDYTLNYDTVVDITNHKELMIIKGSDVPVYAGVIFEVTVPEKEGYIIEGTNKLKVNAASKLSLVETSPRQVITYKRIRYYTGTGNVTLQSDQGGKDILVTDAGDYKVGDTFEVDAPIIDGYTANPQTVTVKVINETTLEVVDGNPGGTNYVTYTKDEVQYIGDGSVKIPSNLDEEITVVYPDSQNLVVGDVIEVNVPDKSGYTKDKTTVKAQVTSANTIEVIDPETEGLVTYTKESTGGGGGTTNPEEPQDTITYKSQVLSVHADVEGASLYDADGKLIADRQLGANSDWASDQILTKMVKNGQIFYRVASNEWVREDDVYVYEVTPMNIRTRADGKYVSLINSRGKAVTNRGLAVDTDWKTDRTIELNGQKYYRVATNEFVSANDVGIS